MKFIFWLLFTIFIFIPATAINAFMWRFFPSEWHQPYRRLR